MKRLALLLVAALLLTLTSCASDQYSKGQQGVGIGAASGALIGQAIGRNTEATLIGAAIGTVLGYIVGNEMDKFDRRELNHAYEFGPSGQSTGWVNPDTGRSYQVTPQPAFRNPSQPQQYCREAEILANIDGRTEKTYTTACRNSQGQWVLQN
ncbi:MAG TPA: glycine zipper domain-containing protein [Desulforhopalus sp.]|jgi:surface antigen|nr:glycine zipper domain-containing protein [Desulforhopalus sp.]